MEEATKKILVISSILIVILILLGISFFILTDKDYKDKIIDLISDKSDNSNQQIPDNQNQDNTDTNTQSSDGTSTGGASGGSSSGGSTTTSNPDCKEIQITYSMTDFNKNSVCNQYDNQICIDKTIACSVKINNRDSETSGTFEAKLDFAPDTDKNNVINSTISTFSLDPQQSRTFSDSINLASTGENGLANQEINCFFNTLQVPTKEIC